MCFSEGLICYFWCLVNWTVLNGGSEMRLVEFSEFGCVIVRV
jgi:hypothetical protein